MIQEFQKAKDAWILEVAEGSTELGLGRWLFDQLARLKALNRADVQACFLASIEAMTTFAQSAAACAPGPPKRKRLAAKTPDPSLRR